VIVVRAPGRTARATDVVQVMEVLGNRRESAELIDPQA